MVANEERNGAPLRAGQGERSIRPHQGRASHIVILGGHGLCRVMNQGCDAQEFAMIVV
jgi:hypothetical protein